MTNLLIIRDYLKAFFQRYERFFTPVVKFFYAFIVLMIFKRLFGYNDDIYNLMIIGPISFVCAFLPNGAVYIVASVFAVYDVMSLSLQVSLVLTIVFIIIYLLYLRFIPGKSWIVMVSMILTMKLPCLIPLVAAMFIGPVAIVPCVCGVVLYYFSIHARQLEPLINASTDDVTDTQIPYLMDTLFSDKEMILFIIIIAVTIMFTYLIYRSSLRYSWFTAIVSGTSLMIFMLLAGTMMIEDDEIELATILIGSLLSGVIAFVVQFFKGVLDYGRIEIVQFEDDDYYYYVKAIPKIYVAERDVNVQTITESTKKVGDDE